MTILRSNTFTVGTTDIVVRDVFSTKSLMPLGGDVRIWYGEYSGTVAELKVEGMLIPEDNLLEHCKEQDGCISFISPVIASVTIHEVK